MLLLLLLLLRLLLLLLAFVSVCHMQDCQEPNWWSHILLLLLVAFMSLWSHT